MKHLEQFEPASVASTDPVDAVVALADEVRAGVIAVDALRVIEQLESARYVVSIIGQSTVLHTMVERVLERSLAPLWTFASARITIRFGRGASTLRALYSDGSRRQRPIDQIAEIAGLGPVPSALEIIADTSLLRSGVCFTIGNANSPPWRRIDMVVTDPVDSREVSRQKRWQGVPMLVLDPSRSDDVDRAIGWMEQVSIDTGAVRVESRITQCRRHLCMRLHHHLVEHHRALGCTHQQMAARLHALTIARELTEAALDAQARQPDTRRLELAGWLAQERTKFLMATRADALIALDQQLAALSGSNHDLRRAALETAHRIAVSHLTRFWDRAHVAATKPVADLARLLIAQLNSSLADLGQRVPLAGIAPTDVAPILGFRRDLEWPESSGLVAHLADRVGLSSRKRVESAARDTLIAVLEGRSERMVERTLNDYDEARFAFERRFCEMLEAAVHSVRVAARFTAEANTDGASGAARARDRIARWTSTLTELMARLD
jgi:hypothetical protein